MTEKEYNIILTDVLTFTGGRRTLTVTDVKRYTGIKDSRTVKSRFPFAGKTITAAVFAARLASEGVSKWP